MSETKLIQFFEQSFSDITFCYRGIYACVIPQLPDCAYELGYGDIIKKYQTADELLNDPIFNGKTLLEIKDEITELEQV